MVDFYKNEQDEYTEGYLGNKEEFNGVVFWLREPHEPKEGDKSEALKREMEEKPIIFWFRNVVNKIFSAGNGFDDRVFYENDLKKDKDRAKRAKTRYSEVFKQLLVHINKCEDELKNAIFFNVHSEWGDKYISKEYSETKYPNTINKIQLMEKCARERSGEKTITIFTCWDIYDIIERYYQGRVGQGVEFIQSSTIDGGVKYTNRKKNKRRLVLKVNDVEIRIYEILHPSRCSYLELNIEK